MRNKDMGMISHFDLVSETEIAALALAFFSSRSQQCMKASLAVALFL